MMTEVVSVLVASGYSEQAIYGMTLEEVNCHLAVINDRKKREVEAMERARRG